jgi:hypothetical protein
LSQSTVVDAVTTGSTVPVNAGSGQHDGCPVGVGSTTKHTVPCADW